MYPFFSRTRPKAGPVSCSSRAQYVFLISQPRVFGSKTEHESFSLGRGSRVCGWRICEKKKHPFTAAHILNEWYEIRCRSLLNSWHWARDDWWIGSGSDHLHVETCICVCFCLRVHSQILHQRILPAYQYRTLSFFSARVHFGDYELTGTNSKNKNASLTFFFCALLRLSYFSVCHAC